LRNNWRKNDTKGEEKAGRKGGKAIEMGERQ
jgi:hypothetical protein